MPHRCLIQTGYKTIPFSESSVGLNLWRYTKQSQYIYDQLKTAALQEAILFDKMEEVISELKHRRWWCKTVPDWVQQYKGYNLARETDFISWLQFVYLPNLQQRGYSAESMRNCSIATQAGRYLGAHADNRKLIQLLVELDSLL